MAFVDDDNGIEFAHDLNQRDVGRVGQKFRARVENLQRAVFLINFANVAVAAVDSKRRVTQHAHAKIFRNGRRRKVLRGQQHVFGKNFDAALKVCVDSATVRVTFVRQRGNGLRQNRVRRNQPHDEFVAVASQSAKNFLQRSARQKSFAAARRNFDANVGHARKFVFVRRRVDTFARPIHLPRVAQIRPLVQAVQISRQVAQNVSLVSFRLHEFASVQR